MPCAQDGATNAAATVRSTHLAMLLAKGSIGASVSWQSTAMRLKAFEKNTARLAAAHAFSLAPAWRNSTCVEAWKSKNPGDVLTAPFALAPIPQKRLEEHYGIVPSLVTTTVVAWRYSPFHW